MASKGSTALMKAWVNTCSVSINLSSELILHCLENNVGFKLVVPALVLVAFQCHIEDHPVNACIAADILFLPSFVETQLNDNQEPALLNASYQLKASEVATCMNAGVAVSRGGSLGWLVQKLMGFDAIMKFLQGPSYVAAHLFHMELIPMDRNEILMSKSLTLREEMALVGFVSGCSQKRLCSLFPTSYMLH